MQNTTPGPWYYDTEGRVLDSPSDAVNPSVIARTTVDHAADARLIAAAPELYDALEALADELDDLEAVGLITDDSADAVRANARAVLAKVE